VSGFSGQISYFTLLKTQRQLVTELDPFFEILVEERPYHEGRVLLAKDFGERWTLEGGMWIRELDDDDKEGTFNHEYRRYFMTPILHDWPLDKSDLSVTAELWEGERQAVRTYGLEITHDFSDDLQIELGSEYALFKFSPAFGEEREQVRTVYLRGNYDLTENLLADLRLEFESDDSDTYRTLRAGLRWRF
jgi:hypothetical protein